MSEHRRSPFQPQFCVTVRGRSQSPFRNEVPLTTIRKTDRETRADNSHGCMGNISVTAQANDSQRVSSRTNNRHICIATLTHNYLRVQFCRTLAATAKGCCERSWITESTALGLQEPRRGQGAHVRRSKRNFYGETETFKHNEIGHGLVTQEIWL